MARIEWVEGITFERYADRWADMVPHLGHLTHYARDCQSIVEFGVRGGVSTWALLEGLPQDGSLIGVDIDPDVREMVPPWVLADPRLTIIIGDDLRVALPEHVDMVIIDSSHEYDQTVDELIRAATLTPQRILLHDYLYGGWCEGVRTAVDLFVKQGEYRFETVHASQWGLAVLVPALIPALICPVVADFGLAENLLATIDTEVGRTVIVDNSLSGWRSGSDRSIEYIRPITGLGYPGGVNAGISQTPEAPWWLFCNADLSFGQGDLATIEQLMTVDDRPRLVTESTRDLRFAYGAINRACVETVGLLDDWSFYPIYYDDDDYERRCRLGGVDWVAFDGSMRHQGSASLDDPAMARANRRTFPANQAAYVAKWGGLPGHETHDTPWDSGLPLWVTRPDPLGRATRLWR